MQSWLNNDLPEPGTASLVLDEPCTTNPAATEPACALWSKVFCALAREILEAVPHPALLLDQHNTIQSCNQHAILLAPCLAQSLGEKSLEWFLQVAGLPLALPDLPENAAREVVLELGGVAHIFRARPLVFQGSFAGRIVELREELSGEVALQESRAVRQQLQELSSCIEISSDGFCIMDSETKIIFVNHVYERITGLKRAAIIGRTMRDLVAQGVFDRSTGMRVLETGRPVTLTLKLGTGKSVLVSASPLFDGNNRISRIVCSIRDITELNRLQNELDSVALLKTRYEEELVDLRRRSAPSGEIVFRSEAMRKIVKLALHMSSVDSTILLQSESGTGKELLANFIQSNSQRANQPFLKINCGAIPEPLLESELFGYVRGAFTGANREGKMGLFEAANKGTLLLDEVGELPRSLQVKLLRALQEKAVRRIGDTISRQVDVRIIASTNKVLASMVAAGDFREDLYYRLNVVPIVIPPLRERKEDIFPLIQVFMEQFNKRYKVQKSLNPRVLSTLLEYLWPGNVRELENIIERLVVTSAGKIINESDLPEDLLLKTMDKLQTLPVKGQTLKEIINNYESRILQHYFSLYKTTREVAEALGIHQSNVVRKLQRLDLEYLVSAKKSKH